VFARIARRWWVIVVAVFLAVVVAFVYLLTTPATYTATLVLAPDQRLGVGGSGNVPPDEFLAAQRDLILSPRVIASAITSLDASARAGGAASDKSLRDALRVNVSPGEQLEVVHLDSSDPQPAARILDAVGEAYLKARAEGQSSAAGAVAELRSQRDQRVAQRAGAEKALSDFRVAANVSGTDADKTAVARLAQLNAALTAAQLELTNANAAAQAAQALLADPQKIQQVVEANRSRGIFAALDQQKNQLESQLSTAQDLLERQRRSMSPTHPRVVETQQTITQVKAKLAGLDVQYADRYRTYLQEQQLTGQNKVDGLKKLIEEQSGQMKDYTAKAAKLAELEADLKRADAALAEVDAKLRDLAAGNASASGAAPTMRIVQPPQTPAHPSHPDRRRVLCTALLVGLIAGLFLAAIGKSSK
jgi:uncharacterized protein involved in exopolysaccharide biosynthesis